MKLKKLSLTATNMNSRVCALAYLHKSADKIGAETL